MKIHRTPKFKATSLQNKVRSADTKNQMDVLRLSNKPEKTVRDHNKRWTSGG